MKQERCELMKRKEVLKRRKATAAAPLVLERYLRGLAGLTITLPLPGTAGPSPSS